LLLLLGIDELDYFGLLSSEWNHSILDSCWKNEDHKGIIVLGTFVWVS
jgi:hypothetical protein